MAILDAIPVHMMYEIDSRRWQQIRGHICPGHTRYHTRSVGHTTNPSLPHTQTHTERCIFIVYIHTYIQQAMRIFSSCEKCPATSQPSRWVSTLPYIAYTCIHRYIPLPPSVCVCLGGRAQADKPIAGWFDIFQAGNMDTERDQNSFKLLKKG